MSDLNPFTALVNEGETSKPLSDNRKNTVEEESLISLLERIFAFSLNEEVAKKKGYRYLGDLFSTCEKKLELDSESLSYYLCERLLSTSNNINDSSSENEGFLNHSRENQTIKYLYECYKVYVEEDLDRRDGYHIIKEEILKNAATAFIYPEIYADQDLFRQLIDILMYDDLYIDFFKGLCQAVDMNEENDGSSLKVFYEKIINLLTSDITGQPLSTFDMRIFDILKILTMQENYAIKFMECQEPKNPSSGVSYATTALGALLNISILPKTPGSEYEHFGNVMSHSALDNTENIVWNKVKMITDQLHLFFLSLLKLSPLVNNMVLNWLSQCIAKNSDREKLWNTQISIDLNLANNTCVSDGFMLQLETVLLKLSEPFCNKKKILKVDPTYCAVPNDLLQEKKIHLLNMSGQTCLLPVEQEDSSEQRPMANSFSFISECFYFTHTVIHLGFVVAVERTIKMNQEFARLERLFEASRSGSRSIGNPDIIREKLRTEMTKFLSYKAQLTEPNMLASMFNFMSHTCYWLCQVAVKQESTDKSNYAPSEESEISFPISNHIPSTLKCIPEFVVNNIICFVNFIKRFNVSVFEEQGHQKLEPILTFILMFMGNHGYMKNPHLRAELAEALEALLPLYGEVISRPRTIESFQRKRLFAEYKFKQQVVRSLLEVFVGIEMTGQSVEFEQKFNYRRPMYKIMEYLWETEEYQNHFRKLAEEAEENMEAVLPPIFLRFINLLINDAVFLLDESLTNMSNLRELQAAREEGESSLPPHEIAQILGSIRQIGMIARFDNILGKDTITALENLTSKITIVFTHSTMVDRMASMLNYFLFNLVGPKKKNFKVKNPKEYNFEPAETVLKICKIYINLKDSDAFCLAISQDGRSYSPQLFSLAEDVLVRIGGTSYIDEIRDLAEKVSRKAEEYQASEETTIGAPDHFLDPIMSTLMTDPVILPSSKQVVDRTTIARHLLSDQTDPFNRSPLSMDQVIPDTELAKEIREWVKGRQNAR
ncbi:ubiquitin conjugation factor E4 A [Coccinella septempunctata]|uniref:ubiquitin conjugation factor E4 A n=1 Tax=Coccinella septempunctata TaxID=41139 RepID=UPI001D06B8D1|nr:ubiquitin conjugation factor E4 A [Coccinella septempunctata]